MSRRHVVTWPHTLVHICRTCLGLLFHTVVSLHLHCHACVICLQLPIYGSTQPLWSHALLLDWVLASEASNT